MKVGRRVVGSAVLLMALTACSQSSAMVRTNEELCSDAFALPIRGAIDVMSNYDNLAAVRDQAQVVLRSTAPSAEVTAAAHTVATSTILIAETGLNLEIDPGSLDSLLGGGLDAISSLTGPLTDLAAAEVQLATVCAMVPSGGTSASHSGDVNA